MKFEVILPLRVVPQPIPPIHTDGDCGACVLAGLLGLAVTDVYVRKRDNTPFSWLTMRQFLLDTYYTYGELDRLIDRTPHWPSIEAQRSFGDPAWLSQSDWFSYVTMALEAGYYGLCNYNMDGLGPLSLSDHFVMIVGVRSHEIHKTTASGAPYSYYTKELLISCSSTKTPPEFWIETQDMLQKHGGYNLFLARPS